MSRVVGTDPGTSSLDLLLLDHGQVRDQARLSPDLMRDEPDRLTRLLESWRPIDLIAGPSGYGLPLIRGSDIDETAIDRMALVRPDERGRDQGVVGFRSWVRALIGTGLPLVFLPGGIHLPTIPRHRKAGAIDHGTADKIAVAALAVWMHRDHPDRDAEPTFAVVEIGTAFSAILVVSGGAVVDTAAGTRGPLGLKSGGGWDGEAAYWRSPLRKADLFRGGKDDLGPLGNDAFRESLRKHAAGLRAVTPFATIYLSGAGWNRPEVAALTRQALDGLGQPIPLPSLPDAWVKHAAQGSALIADGLLGGPRAELVASLRLREATGSLLDHLEPEPVVNR
jgi:predicted butyrate kinase (DUF1464 family)